MAAATGATAAGWGGQQRRPRRKRLRGKRKQRRRQRRTGAEEMASVTEQWAEQAEGVAAGAVTAMARLGQKLAELQAELQVRGRWIHSAHGSDSGATPPVRLSWCPHTPAHSGRPCTAPRRGHAFSLWSGCGMFGAHPRVDRARWWAAGITAAAVRGGAGRAAAPALESGRGNSSSGGSGGESG
jgi:hypothetical protein